MTWAESIDRGPDLDALNAAIGTHVKVALLIFAAYFGLRFMRRLLGT
ncbi:hypothetical protein [Patulibacter medicamentivorans]|nr:hypothetical protein [Patulibacter medicamentivorans]